jgi:hypothetical protein
MQVSCIENMALEKIKRKASDGIINSNKKKKGTHLPQMDKSTADSPSTQRPNPIVIDITSDGDSSGKNASGQANDELSQ